MRSAASATLSQFGGWHICTRPAAGNRYLSFAIQRPFTYAEVIGNTIDIPDEMHFEFGDTADEALGKLHRDLTTIS